jgi:hypothetical protein
MGSSTILGGTANGDTARKTLTETGKTNRRNPEKGEGVISHAFSLRIQRVGKTWP